MFSVNRSYDRSLVLKRFSESEILGRYKTNYGLSNITFEQVKHHVEVEARLTDELAHSTPENRVEAFARAYATLYQELPWLAGTGTHTGAEQWVSLMKAGASVYEVGSGAGYLIRYLAAHGFRCTGTDLSPDRQKAASAADENVTWAATDGVHLSRFAGGARFDYVISDMVVEHLHPDDTITHFREARELLKEGGCYLMRTAYAAEGPTDLSAVFGEPAPVFMHLHEFNYDEIDLIRRTCGYRSVKAVFELNRLSICTASAAYFRFCRLFDRFEAARQRVGPTRFRKVRRHLRLPQSVWVVFQR